MDERQAQIKEGAGLEESRVNQEFLDFLNRWSFPVLLIIAIVSGGYFVYNQWQARKIAARDQAFAELGNMESSNAPSVFSLTTIADEYEGVGHVSELALLQAASIHLNAVRTGLDPADPDASNPESLLSDEDIEHYQKIVVALSETIRIMGEIDEVIEATPYSAQQVLAVISVLEIRKLIRRLGGQYLSPI